LFHLSLLVLAILTTTFTGGAMLRGYLWSDVKAALDAQDINQLWDIFQAGQVFTLPLLLILGTHEMGHYIVARLHKVKVTLPFFIPLPVWGSLGTLGAVIFIQSPFRNRKMLFDIGIAGPLAGLVVSIGVFLIGLNHPYSYDYPAYFLNLGINRVTVPPFLDWIAQFVWSSEKIANIDRIVFYHRPEAMAGWFGILLTALNLLPLGQFDGGHMMFAMLGRRFAWAIAILISLAVGIVVVMSIGLKVQLIWFGWIIYPLIALLTGLRHPPPHDDITPIGLPRMLLGAATFGLFLTMIVAVPFYSTIR
jgi:membrane-associated protease RseP (regulator of RpoE activity)